MTEPISADFPFESNYVEVHGSRMHYIDEGEGEPVVFLHGNPTSSYLWRNVIPHVSPHARCIAPDLIGFGKSDKPESGYRFFDHARYLDAFFDALGLDEYVTLVLHDWGSGLGFHWARRHEDRVKGICFMEAIIRTSKWKEFPTGYKQAFQLMRTPGTGYGMVMVGNMFVKGILPSAIVRKLTKREKQAYAEPFPTVKSRKPVLVWPREIPIDGEPADMHDTVTAYNAWLCETHVPKLLLYADPGGLIDAHGRAMCERDFPNLESLSVGKGVHYLQEDNPHGIGEAIAEWYQRL